MKILKLNETRQSPPPCRNEKCSETKVGKEQYCWEITQAEVLEKIKKKSAALSVYYQRFLNCFIHFDGRTDTAFVTGVAKAPSSKMASIENATAQDTSCYKCLRELIRISATVLSYFSYSA